MQATFNQEFDLFFGTTTNSAALNWVSNLDHAIDSFGAGYIYFIDKLMQVIMTLPFYDQLVEHMEQVCMFMCRIGEIQYSYYSGLIEEFKAFGLIEKLKPVGDLLIESFIQIAKAKTMVYVQVLDIA